MAEPNPKEKQLLELSMSYDQAIESCDADTLKHLLTNNVVLHKDELTLFDDVVGKDAVANYFEAYWEKYTFKHEAIAGAVDANKMAVFSFSADRDVTPKREAFPGLPDDAYKPRTTVCIHKHEISHDNKIQAIWFLRTLSSDEMHRKLANPPNYDAFKFDPFEYKGSHKGQSMEARDNHYKVTQQFCEMYRAGNVSVLDEIMEDDARVICPTLAIEYHGRDKFKQHLKEVFEHRWQSKSDREDIAATAGDKSFVHWISRGIDQAMGEEVSMYGLDMLVISDKNRIKDAVMFSQLMPSKRKELLKEE